MASCSAINLELIPQQKLLSDCYGFKLVLSEGISEPSLAKLTLITNRALGPNDLHKILGLVAKVEIVQSQSTNQNAADFDATKLNTSLSHADLGGLDKAISALDVATKLTEEFNQGLQQEQLSCRYFTGRVVQASFVQKVSRKLINQSSSATLTSYVYELHIASYLYYLAQNNHQRFIHNHSDLEALKILVSTNFLDTQQTQFQQPNSAQGSDNASTLGAHNASAQGSISAQGSNSTQGSNQDSSQGSNQGSAQSSSQPSQLSVYNKLDYVVYNLGNLKHDYTCTIQQETESDYALFMRLIYLSNLNYSFTYKPDLNFEQLNISYGLDQIASPLLYQPSDKKVIKVDTNFNLDQQGSCIRDLNYTCTGQPSPELNFLTQKDLNGKLESTEQQILLADPFVKWLMPTAFGHNRSKVELYNFCKHLCSVKLNQLQNESENITAQATNLAFQPGLSFSLQGLGSTPLHLMVRSVSLSAVAPFPTDKAYPAVGCAEKALELNLKLVNIDNYNKVFGCLADVSGLLQSEQAFNFARLNFAISNSSSNANSSFNANSNLNASFNASQGNASAAFNGANASFNGAHASGFNGAENACYPALIQPAYLQNTRFTTATVCTELGSSLDSQKVDWSGKVYLSANDNVSQPSLFWAKLDDTQELVLVEKGNTADAFPRVGSNIRLLITHGHCVYLSQIDPVRAYQKCFDDGERIGQLYSQHWSNYQPQKGQLNQACAFDVEGSKPSHSIKAREVSEAAESGMAEMGLDYVDTTADLIIFHFKRNTLDSLAMHQATSQNNAWMYNSYSKIKKDLDGVYQNLLKYQKEYEVAFNTYYQSLINNAASLEQDQKKLNQATSYYIEHYNLFYLYIQRIAEILSLKLTKGTMLSNMYADEGQVLLGSGKGEVSLLAPKVNASASEQVHLSAKKIVLSADDKLVLAVGGNSLSISRSGITIESRKWTATSGLLDSYISLDSISGIAIEGMKVGITGALKASLEDGICGSISVANGAVKASGLRCSLESSMSLSFYTTLLQRVSEFVNEIGSLATVVSGNNSDASDTFQSYLYYGLSDLYSLTDIVEQGLISYKFPDSTAAQKMTLEWWCDLIDYICTIIVAVASLVEHIMANFFGDKLNALVNENIPNYTVRDCLRTISGIFKFSLSIENLIKTVVIGNQGLAKSNFSMSPYKILNEAREVKTVELDAVNVNAPAAGVPQPAQQPQQQGQPAAQQGQAAQVAQPAQPAQNDADREAAQKQNDTKIATTTLKSFFSTTTGIGSLITTATLGGIQTHKNKQEQKAAQSKFDQEKAAIQAKIADIK